MQAGPEVSATAADALAAFYAAQGLPPDGGCNARRWTIAAAGLSVPMPNFAWRTRALPLHDLHHLLTGYPCTPVGEFEMAAWEFAAGRYPHPGATAFCMPLVALGAALAPRRTFAAFLRGRASATLYARGLSPAVLGATVEQLRQVTLPSAARNAGARDFLAYGGLVALSAALLFAPLLAAWLAWSWL